MNALQFVLEHREQVLATIGDVITIFTGGMAISLVLFYWRGEGRNNWRGEEHL